MQPPIPKSLSRIDSATVREHFSLDSSDECFYIWEQTARGGYGASPTNQFIKNLKIKPSEIATNPKRNYYKQQALAHGATAIRKLLGKSVVESSITVVRIPSSKIKGDPEYDDRIGETLKRAFDGWKSDIQPLLNQTISTDADHEGETRMSFAELLQVTSLAPSIKGVRSLIIIADDILNSGKHFKVAKHLLSIAYPSARISGLFLARCIRDNNAFSDIDDFDTF